MPTKEEYQRNKEYYKTYYLKNKNSIIKQHMKYQRTPKGKQAVIRASKKHHKTLKYKKYQEEYLKINHKGNGEIIAPVKDPITKKWSNHNLVCTGGTIWGTIKAIIIVFFLLFLLWRYNVEVKDCLEIRANYDETTGCINRDYFFGREKISIERIEELNDKNKLSLPSLTEGNDKPLS